MHGIFGDSRSNIDPDANPMLFKHIKTNLVKQRTQANLKANQQKTFDKPVSVGNSEQKSQEIQIINSENQPLKIVDEAAKEAYRLEQFNLKFDAKHKGVIFHKQLSQSPSRSTHLLSSYIKDSNKVNIEIDKEKPLIRQLRLNKNIKIHLRYKSEYHQDLASVIEYSRLWTYIKKQKQIANFELLDIYCFENAMFQSQILQTQFYKTCVDSLKQLIEQFIAKSNSQMIEDGLDTCKQILIKFEQLKSDYNSKLDLFEPEEVKIISYLFSQTRFVFSKFGRVVTIYEVLYQRFKNSTQGQSFRYNSQTSIKKNQKFDSLEPSSQQNFKTQLPLDTLNLKEKSDLLTKQYFKLQRSVWREQYEQERAQIVPVIICRVCAQKFYADQAKKHSQFCIEKVEKLADQRKLYNQFLQMSSKATETMLLIQQQTIAATQNQAQNQLLLSTPTLQRRVFQQPPSQEQKPNVLGQLSGKPNNYFAQLTQNSKLQPIEETKEVSSKEDSLAQLKNFTKDLSAKLQNQSAVLMTPQPQTANLQFASRFQNKNQPAASPSNTNYFSTLTTIRKDVPAPQTDTSVKQQPVPSLTPISESTRNVVNTPKPQLKAGLESLLKVQLPRSPYLTSFEKNFSQKSTVANHSSEQSSVKKGSRVKYWQSIQKEISTPKSTKNELKIDCESSTKQNSMLERRIQQLLEPKQVKKSKTVSAPQPPDPQSNKPKFNQVPASPLISHVSRFQKPPQAQVQPAPVIQKQPDVQSLLPVSGLAKSVCATPQIRSVQSTRLIIKQDLESLESIKTMCNDAFSLSVQADPLSNEQQIEIFKNQRDRLITLSALPVYNQKTLQLIKEYVELVESKVKFLKELMVIEGNFMLTLPSIAKKQKEQEDKINEQKMQKILQHTPRQATRKLNTLGDSKDLKKLTDFRQFKPATTQPLDQIQMAKQLSRTNLSNFKDLEVIQEKVTLTKSYQQKKQDIIEEKSESSETGSNQKFGEGDISDFSSDEVHSEIIPVMHFDTQVRNLILLKMLNEEIPRKPLSPIYVVIHENVDPEDIATPAKQMYSQPLSFKTRCQKSANHKEDNEFDIVSFSSESQQSQKPLKKPKIKSKSEVRLRTSTLQRSDSISCHQISEFMDLIYVKNMFTKDEEQRDQKQNNLSIDSQSWNGDSSISSKESEDEVLTIDQVRFNSCSNLPSHLASCKIEQKQELGLSAQITDFQLLKTLSWGAYGRVVLSRKKDTKDLFAIKVMDKAQMVNLNVAEFVMNERNILNKVDCDFIVRGMYTFQTHKYLYMVMEYMRGGDFSNLLEKWGYFNHEAAKFYLAHVVVALEHLQSSGIVHRDLKPENMLIGADGHIKLTDFGLSDSGLKQILDNVTQKPKLPDQGENKSSENQKQKNRIVGTADYMAPEVIKGEEVSVLMDFWSLGILAFEFLTGNLPFNSDTPEEIFNKILNMPINMPEVGVEEGQVHPDAKDFLEKLLKRDPSKRLGAKKGIREIKEHPFFTGINWKTLIKEVAPWVPPPLKDLDMSNFPKAQTKDDPGLKQLIQEEGLDSGEMLVAPGTPKLNVQAFNQFDGVSYSALRSINEREGEKALKWAQRQLKKMQDDGKMKKISERFTDSETLFSTNVKKGAIHSKEKSVDI